MQNNNPQKSTLENILMTAFSYWNRTLLYQLIFSLLYFSLFFLGYFYLFNYFGLWEEFSKHNDLIRTDYVAFNKKMQEISQLPQARNFTLAFFLLTAFINPLHVGFYKIYRKLDLNEKIEFNDLFAGYLGFDFFKFLGFYIFWIIIFTYANALLIMGFVWIFVTLFSVPLMFFMNINAYEGISLTVKGLRRDFGTILICVIVATLFSLSGTLLCGIGFLFTFPFMHAMIYTLYQHIYKEIG